MALRGINHVTLCVADLDRSLRFYSDVLGAVPRAVWDRGAYLDLGGLWLCLETAPEVTLRRDDSHIALDCDAADFDAFAARIASAATLWKDNRSEGKSLYFLDPDGHKLEIHVGGLDSRIAHCRATRPGDFSLLTEGKPPELSTGAR